MSSRILVAAGITLLVGGLGLTAPPGSGAEGPPEGVSLTGYWKLDRDRSDDPDDKAREALEGMRTDGHDPGGETPTGPGIDVTTPGDPRTTTPAPAGPGQRGPYGRPGERGQYPYGGGRDPRAAVFPEIDRPKELTIAQRTSLVLIQEGDDEGSVRGVHTDGQRRQMPAGRGEIRGAWEDGQLIVETWRSDGVQTVETYELTADPRELKVTLSVMARGMNPLTVESVYVPDPSKNR
ncbi:MAG: hypothetical protein ACYTFI_28705 [Planctomycetota bacterium]|jgi:hypothetical protein